MPASHELRHLPPADRPRDRQQQDAGKQVRDDPRPDGLEGGKLPARCVGQGSGFPARGPLHDEDNFKSDETGDEHDAEGVDDPLPPPGGPEPHLRRDHRPGDAHDDVGHDERPTDHDRDDEPGELEERDEQVGYPVVAHDAS